MNPRLGRTPLFDRREWPHTSLYSVTKSFNRCVPLVDPAKICRTTGPGGDMINVVLGTPTQVRNPERF